MKINKNNTLYPLLFLLGGCTSLSDSPLNQPPPILGIRAPASTFQGDTLVVILAESEKQPEVTATLRDDGGSSIEDGLLQELRDDGLGADQVAMGRQYTALLNTANLTNLPSSFFTIEVRAKLDGLVEGASFTIANSNSAGNQPPEIVDIQLPDTLVVDPLMTVFFNVEVTVTDPNGLQDIKSVTLFSAQSGTPIAIDEPAGAGVYSRTLSLPPDTEPGIFMFRFQAIDRVGATSANVLREVVVVE